VLPGDRYLLCSDGLNGVLHDEEIAAVVRGEPPAVAVRTLVDRVNQRGGPDNITVQIAVLPRSTGGVSARVATWVAIAIALGAGVAWLVGAFDGAG
jgi:serine/threonine protein phosphatase PrpC